MDKFPGVPLTADQLREVTRQAIEKKDKDNTEWFERLVVNVSRMLWNTSTFNGASSHFIPYNLHGGAPDEDGYQYNLTLEQLNRLTERLRKDGYDAVINYEVLGINVSWEEKQ